VQKWTKKKWQRENRDRVAVVIPTLNEEENLAAIIEKCKRYCSELIVVD
jgi:glycosyltransferase involved in cell wall biosynthesis